VASPRLLAKPKLLVALVFLILPLQLISPWRALAETDDEQAVAHLVNDARRDRGISALSFSSSISRVAHTHSVNMADADSLFHSCVECIRSERGWQVIGENIAYGTTIRSVHRGLMQSTYHRENILCTCFTHVAVGVVRSAGLVWVTEIFYRP
jgi:uncharacterized protein YkwD